MIPMDSEKESPFYHYSWSLFTRYLEEQYDKVWELEYCSQFIRTKPLRDIEDYNS
jgi:hypothetical protein